MAVGTQLRWAEQRLGGGRGTIGSGRRKAVGGQSEKLPLLDPVAEGLQKAVPALVAEDTGAKDLVRGTLLGPPLHPAVTNVVVGSWTAGAPLDVLRGERSEQAADLLVG